MSSQRNNRNRVIQDCRSGVTHGLRCTQTVQFRHFHVHEHNIIRLRCQGSQGSKPIPHYIGALPQLLQHRQNHPLIDQVVLGHQNTQWP